MLELSDAESKKVQMALLERRYPQIKGLLEPGEILLSASKRQPLRITGILCILISIVGLEQLLRHCVPSHSVWFVLGVVACAASGWEGVRLAYWIGKEYVFVIDRRVAYWKINFAGKLTRAPHSIPLSEITGVHLYKNGTMFGGHNRSTGDILIKKVSGHVLLPSFRESVGLCEILMEELASRRGKSLQNEKRK